MPRPVLRAVVCMLAPQAAIGLAVSALAIAYWIHPSAKPTASAYLALGAAWLVLSIAGFLAANLTMARLARHLRAARGRLCPRCCYDLSGLEKGDPCPECGRFFDPIPDGELWDRYVEWRG